MKQAAGVTVFRSSTECPRCGNESQVRIRRFRSSDELRSGAESWNRLWEASATSIPSVRVEPIALWCDAFLGADALDAWLLEVNDRPVAALPLVKGKVKRVYSARWLPTNPLLAYADFLLDGGLVDPAPAIGQLLEAILRDSAGATLLWLENVAYLRHPWPLFLNCARQMGFSMSIRHSHTVGHTVLAEDWQSFERRMKKRYRQNLRRHKRRIQEAHGELSLERLDVSSPSAAREATRRMFEVEARSWKAKSGTAVLQDPVALNYYQRLAEALAETGDLAVYLLRVGARPIASAYALNSKGTCHLVKLGCDDSFRKFGPGQLLIYELMQAAHACPHTREIDFFGELSDYQKCWVNRAEPVGRVVIARRGLKLRAFFEFYEHIYPRLKRLGRFLLRKRPSPTECRPAMCRCLEDQLQVAGQGSKPADGNGRNKD